MPRQYNIRPGGPAAPNVGQFGAADISLQSPTFRAQTAVDAGDNPFEYLQKILGVAGALTAQVIDSETMKVKGEIAKLNIEEQKEREARQEERAAKIEAREQRVEMEREQRQAAAAFESKYNTQLELLQANNDIEGLAAFRKSLIDKNESIEQSDNQFIKSSYSQLLGKANATFTMVERGIEQDNNDRERAAAEAARTLADEKIMGVGAMLLQDTELADEIKNADPKASLNAIQDFIISRMTEADPLFMKTVYEDGSDVEKKAVTAVIRKETEAIFNRISEQRNNEIRLQISNMRMLESVNTAREDFPAAVESLDSRYAGGLITQTDYNRGLAMAANAHIGSGETPQERSTRAMSIIMDYADKPVVAGAAQVMLGKAIREIKDDVDIHRRDVFESPDNLVEVDPRGNEVGWRRRFDSQAELVDWFYETKMGILPFERDDPRYRGLQSIVGDLMKEFDQDTAATERNVRQMESSMSRSPTIKAQKSANDGWFSSPLRNALETRAFVEMPQDQVDVLMINETGFAGNAPPADLMKMIGSLSSDPQAFRVINSFFAHFPPSNPVVAAELDNKSFHDAWVQSVLYRGLITSYQGSEEQARNELNSRMSQLRAYRTQQVQGLIPKEMKDKTEKAITDGVKSMFGSEYPLPADDMLLLTSLADMHIGSGGDPAQSVAFAREVMARDLQYSEIPVVRGGKTSKDLVFNPQNNYGTKEAPRIFRVLPDSATMSQTGPGSWSNYIDDHKSIASEYIGSLPQFDGKASPDDTAVVSLELSTDPIEMQSGGCSLIATTRTGVRYRIPQDRISISHYNFTRWMKAVGEERIKSAETPTSSALSIGLMTAR